MQKHSCEEDIVFYLNEQFNEENEGNSVNIRLKSNSIKIYKYQLYKFCAKIRNEYDQKDIENRLNQEILAYQEKYQIQEENIIIFFKLIQEDRIIIKPNQYSDLCKLSKLFEVESLHQFLKKYTKRHQKDPDFILTLMIYHQNDKNDELFDIDDINEEMEESLSDKIGECLSNSKFQNLPISTVYRILEKSDRNNIPSDLLFEYIAKSIEERFVLLYFIDVKSISDQKLNEMIELETSSPFYFQHMKCDLKYIRKIKDENKNDQVQINKLNEIINNLKKQLNQSIQCKNEIEIHIKQSEVEKNELKGQLKQLEIEKNEIQEQLNRSKQNINELEAQFKQLEMEKNEIQEQLNQSKQNINELDGKFKQLEIEKNEIKEQLNQSEQNKSYNKTQIKQLQLEKNEIENTMNEVIKIEGIYFYIHKNILNHACELGKIELVKYLMAHSQIDIISKYILNKYFGYYIINKELS